MDCKTLFVEFLQEASGLEEVRGGAAVFEREEVQGFLGELQGVRTRGEVDELLRELGPYMVKGDVFRVSVLGVICGALIERGGDAAIIVHEGVRLLKRVLEKLVEYVGVQGRMSEEEIFEQVPDALRAKAALEFAVPAAMTMLCREKEARKYWRQQREFMELVVALDEDGEIPYFVRRTLEVLDDKELLLLDAVNTRGFLVRLSGVQDVMYHCYALVQHTILEHAGPRYLDAEPTDVRAVKYARNEGLTQEDYQEAEELMDWQRFGFSYPGGLFFPGSASFEELPVVDGVAFLLIEKKSMTFQWQPSNMYPVLHEALRSQVEMVRELERDEVVRLLGRVI